MDMKKALLAAAVAGISSQSIAGEVKCWSGWDKATLSKVGKDTNGCGVAKSDKKAILADKKLKGMFPDQGTHGCGGHIKPKHATWVKISKSDCKKAGGFLIKKVDGKKMIETL